MQPRAFGTFDLRHCLFSAPGRSCASGAGGRHGSGRQVISVRRVLGIALLLVLCCGPGDLRAQTSTPDALRARFAAIRANDAGSLIERSVYLLSSESSGRMSGDVYALVDQPYVDLRHALAQADHWCDILILHLNVKYCRAASTGARQEVVTGVGRKFDQPLSDVYWAKFDFTVPSASDGYLNVVLQAPAGPLNTKDYRFLVEAVPFTERQSLLHMNYAYAYGQAADWAMHAYLATIGHDKVGFSVVGRRADGRPVLVGGVRGVLERNALRYYLAIEAHLRARMLAPAAQLARSLDDWFAATERFALQLHEVDHDTYVEMKLREVRRQQTRAPPPIN